MINIGAGVADIINDPMSHGIGAGIQGNTIKQVTKTWKKTTPVVQGKPLKVNTLQSVLSNAAKQTVKQTGTAVTETISQKTKTVQNNINEDMVGDLFRSLVGGNRKANTLSGLVDMTMKKSVDEMLQDQIKKGKLSLKTSQLGTTYATARAYYKKLYDGDKIMMDLRNKTEKNISNTINKALNDKLASWQNKLPSWQKRLLANTKLASSLRKYINVQTEKCIQGIFGDSVIKSWNSKLISNLNTIKDKIKNQIQVSFKGGIEYYKKLRQAIADKIKVYQEMKTRFEKHISSIINDYKSKISAAVKQFTEHLVSSVGSSLKSLASGVKL